MIKATDGLNILNPNLLSDRYLRKKREAYLQGVPFCHVVLDDFMSPEIVNSIIDEFSITSKGSDQWINYHHFNEKKRGFNGTSQMGPVTQSTVAILNSPAFIQILRTVTGIEGLIADPGMDGGGMHEMKRDGFLNMHVDFLVHTLERHWSRQVNLLLFFNKDWRDEYNGHLEFWDRDINQCVKNIRPGFNRCVIFHTSRDSYHGVPEKILCPPDRSRKSLALYYFKDEGSVRPIQSTHYRARPKDSVVKSAFIVLDRWALKFYSHWKRTFGVSESSFTKWLKLFFK